MNYFTIQISDHLEVTEPEGFLIARDCTIARTGWQQYKVADLPQDSAEMMGIDTSRGGDLIDLYRPPEEVFHPDTLASFEGKPITDNHPPGFVTPENFTEFARGHIQNVRKGSEPLDSGDWPMIADVHINAEPLLSKVRNKVVRELSCGYDYSIRKDGDKILQVDITGNHVAVVPRGRAGSEARIYDAAPDAGAEATSTLTAPTTIVPPKEKQPVKVTLRTLLGLGFKEFAKDAEPEALAEAAAVMGQTQQTTTGGRVAARDNEEEHEQTEHADDRRSASDRAAADKRKKLHDALDRALDAEFAGLQNGGARDGMESEMNCDSDLEAVEKGLAKFFKEEEQEPQHQEGEDTEEGEGAEIGEVTEPSGEEVDVPAGDRRAAADRANDRARAADGAAAVLNALRPFVARTKDSAIRKAFNTAVTNVNKVSRPTSARSSYSAVAQQSRQRARAADSRSSSTANGGKPKPYADLQKFYDTARTEGVK